MVDKHKINMVKSKPSSINPKAGLKNTVIFEQPHILTPEPRQIDKNTIRFQSTAETSIKIHLVTA